MIETIVKKNVIMACYFTGVHDVNRNETLLDNDILPIVPWLQSIIDTNLQAVVFHNSLHVNTIAKYLPNVVFIKVALNNTYSPNVYRYFLYKNYLDNNTEIQNCFVTDITDVIVKANPFIQPLFINNANCIFCGDEPKRLNNEWMNSHSASLRAVINNYAAYELQYKNATLLNCGIIGGGIAVMRTFFAQLCTVHATYNANNTSLYTGDMGAFNYLIRTKYNEVLVHGEPVNTVFKLYQHSRTDCWFQHK